MVRVSSNLIVVLCLVYGENMIVVDASLWERLMLAEHVIVLEIRFIVMYVMIVYYCQRVMVI